MQKPTPHPQACEIVAMEIGQVAMALEAAWRSPPGTGRSTEIAALEKKLGELQSSYERDCRGKAAR